MPTAFSDPSPTLYLVLGVVTVIFGAVAVRRQRRSDVINFLIPAALLLALFLIDWAIETPREQVTRKIGEMGTASQSKKYDDLFRHVSETFRYRSLDKKGLRDRARLAESMGFGGIAPYDLARSGFKSIDENMVEQGFRVKHKGEPPLLFYVVATFKKDPDGEWRLGTFKLFDPVNVNDEKDIPGA